MVSRRLDPSLARRIDPDDVLTETFLRARQRWQGFKSGMMGAPTGTIGELLVA